MRTALFGIYRLGNENGKVQINPAKLLKRCKVSGGRMRFLDQFEPLDSGIDYLKPLKTEGQRLRAIIERDCPEHVDKFEIALHTGMRRSEQYQRINWGCVDLSRKDLHIPTSKNGQGRHVPLNANARAAFERLSKVTIGEGPIPIAPEGPVFTGRGGARVRTWALV